MNETLKTETSKTPPPLPSTMGKPPILPIETKGSQYQKVVLIGTCIFVGAAILLGAVGAAVVASKTPPAKQLTIEDYPITMRTIEVLDVNSRGSRVRLPNGEDVFIVGWRGLSDRSYDMFGEHFRDIGPITYTTIMGATRRIPAYEIR